MSHDRQSAVNGDESKQDEAKCDDSELTPEVLPYPWGPRDYRRFTVMLAVGIHLYLYLGMIILAYLINGAEWILGWKPAVFAIISALVFSRLSFGWVMRLDAQYGRGSGWELKPVTVKLPEERDRPRKR